MRFEVATLDHNIGVYLDGRLSLITHWNEKIRALVRASLVEHADKMEVSTYSPMSAQLNIGHSRFKQVALQMDSRYRFFVVRNVKKQLKILPADLAYEHILAESRHFQGLYRMLH